MSENSPRKDRRHRTAFRRRANRNEDSERNERYFSKGPLSPLRSPLTQKQGQGVSKYSDDRRERRACWKELDTTEFTKISLKDEDYPDLGICRFTPEDKNNTNRGVVRDNDDGSNEGKRYRRKLELTDNRKNSKKVNRENSRTNVEGEKDEATLTRRQKAIDYGKNTIAYDNYVAQIKRNDRKKGYPRTPDKAQKCSRRSWDQQIRLWRLGLHHWNNSQNPGQCAEGLFADTSSESASEVGDRSSTPSISIDGDVYEDSKVEEEQLESCDEDRNSWAYQVSQEKSVLDDFDFALCMKEDTSSFV